MNRRGKIIVSVTGIFIVLLILIGLTYAYFLTRITGNSNPNSISVTTADLKIVYTDGDSDGDGVADALIIADKVMPNTTITSKKFNVTNQGNAKSTYSVVLDKIENEFERNQDLVYTLTRNGVDEPVSEGHLVVGTKQIILPSAEIEKDETHTYALTIKYIEAGVDQSIDMNKVLNLRVNIENETVTWDTAKEGTLLYALKNNQPTGTVETIPGKQISDQNEARLLTTEDDYGTSYVYRGNVVNNYVTYANMCWRVVRVQGDGTIKLVLDDRDNGCKTEEGYDISDYQSYFILDPANRTFVYGDLDFYSEPYLLSNPMIPFIYETSYVAEVLNAWLNGGAYRYLDSDGTFKNDSFVQKINSNNQEKLVTTTWCNDVSIASKTISEWDENTDKVDYTFGPYNRLVNANPTLKCNQKGLEFNNEITKAIRYQSNIGILTADEIAFAGDVELEDDSVGQKNVYLNRYISSSSYDGHFDYFSNTMSPFNITQYIDPISGEFSYGDPYHFVHHSNMDANYYYGGLGNAESGIYNSSTSIRPSVVLRSDVIIESGGNGTQNNPYIIK